MDLINMFNVIDSDQSGEITYTDLVEFMRKNHYSDEFVDRWLEMFDLHDRGRITMEDFCETLGLEIDENIYAKYKKHRPSLMNLDAMTSPDKNAPEFDEFVDVGPDMEQHIVHVCTDKPLATPTRKNRRRSSNSSVSSNDRSFSIRDVNRKEETKQHYPRNDKMQSKGGSIEEIIVPKKNAVSLAAPNQSIYRQDTIEDEVFLPESRSEVARGNLMGVHRDFGNQRKSQDKNIELGVVQEEMKYTLLSDPKSATNEKRPTDSMVDTNASDRTDGVNVSRNDRIGKKDNQIDANLNVSHFGDGGSRDESGDVVEDIISVRHENILSKMPSVGSGSNIKNNIIEKDSLKNEKSTNRNNNRSENAIKMERGGMTSDVLDNTSKSNIQEPKNYESELKGLQKINGSNILNAGKNRNSRGVHFQDIDADSDPKEAKVNERKLLNNTADKYAVLPGSAAPVSDDITIGMTNDEKSSLYQEQLTSDIHNPSLGTPPAREDNMSKCVLELQWADNTPLDIERLSNDERQRKAGIRPEDQEFINDQDSNENVTKDYVGRIEKNNLKVKNENNNEHIRDYNNKEEKKIVNVQSESLNNADRAKSDPLKFIGNMDWNIESKRKKIEKDIKIITNTVYPGGIIKEIVQIFEENQSGPGVNYAEVIKKYLDLHYDRVWHVIITTDEYGLHVTYTDIIMFEYGDFVFAMWQVPE